MKRFILSAIFLALPVGAFAYSYDTSHLPYTDVPNDLETQVALSLLTDIGVIKGNPNGSFAPTRTLNRAEFVTIVMRLNGDTIPSATHKCFIDVSLGMWYTDAVCEAKARGIVEGEDEYFSPDRPINYVEAMKVLVEYYQLPLEHVQGDLWYTPYMRAARKRGLQLADGIEPAHFVTRAEMARLTAGFVANGQGELALFRNAQAGISRTSSSASSRTFSSSSSSSSSQSSSSASYDSYGSVELRQNVLILGEVSPVLGSVSLFSNTQPIDITDITVTTTSVVQSIDSLLVFDENAKYIGRATKASDTTYTLRVRTEHVQVPYRQSFSLYVRAQMKPFTAGGVSGESIQIDSISITGNGAWSSSTQSQTSSDTFPVFQTARSLISSIENADSDRGALIAGTNQPIGSFRFSGRTSDGQADLALTDLAFTIETIGGVSITNAELGADGTSQRLPCTVTSATVVCSNIDPQFGSFEDRSRVLTLYADVTVPPSAQKTALRLTLNQGGSPSSIGAITWTDGSTSFTWVPFESPVARGTYLE